MEDLWSKERELCVQAQQKAGLEVLPTHYRVMHPNTSFAIMVLSTSDEHHHEEEAGFTTKENYHWTSQQENIVAQSLLTHMNNTLILEVEIVQWHYALSLQAIGELLWQTWRCKPCAANLVLAFYLLTQTLRNGELGNEQVNGVYNSNNIVFQEDVIHC